MVKTLLQEMFILKSKGYYKQAIEILYKLLEVVDTQEETIEIIYELAEIYLFSNNMERANHYLEKLLDIMPNHAEALRLQIKLTTLLKERIKIAKKLFQVTNKPEDLKLYLMLLNKAGEYEETVGYVDTTYQAFCYQEIAEAMYNLGNYQEAKSFLESQENLTETSELLLARLCYTINDDESLKLLESRLSKSKNADVLKFIINLEFELMNYAKMLKLAKGVNLFNNTNLLYIVGQANYYRNNTQDAKKCLNMLCEQDNNPKYKFALALAYVKAGQTSQAIDALKNESQYLKLLTLMLNEKSLSQRVLEKEFIAMLELFRADEFARYEVVELCFKREILGLVNELLKLPRQNKNIRHDFYMIKLLIRSGNYDEAEVKVLRYRNYEAFAMLYAELLNQRNDFAKLESLLNNRSSYEVNEYEQCCYYYARIFESKGEYLRAIDVAQKGLDFINCYGEMYYTLLYGLYKHINDMPTALECLEKAAKYNPQLRPLLIQEAAKL